MRRDSNVESRASSAGGRKWALAAVAVVALVLLSFASLKSLQSRRAAARAEEPKTAQAPRAAPAQQPAGTPTAHARESVVRPKEIPIIQPSAKALPLAGVTGVAPDEFVALFNGRDLSGWVAEDGDASCWSVADGELILSQPNRQNKWLLSVNDYADYILKLEFKLSAGGNSGVAFRAVLNEPVQGNAKHLEVQILDDSSVSGAQLDQGAGALYRIACDRAASLRPVGEWNEMQIEQRGLALMVSVNGRETLSTRLDQLAAFNTDERLRREKGRVGLQAHGQSPVSFRNIRIQDLSAAASSVPPTPAAVSLSGLQPGQPWTNSLGMVFVPVPGTAVRFSIWKTRVQDFEAFAQATGHDATKGVFTLATDGWKQRGGSWKQPGFAQSEEHPVCCVSWDDAKAFCNWLTEKERAEGRLRADQAYRLPTDAEWSIAVGLENETGPTPKDKSQATEGVYPWGREWPPLAGAGNYGGAESRTAYIPSTFGVIEEYRDGYPCASPVGSFKANRFGLFDLGGNLWEWCEDLYDGLGGSHALRGASWSYFFSPPGRASLLSSFRWDQPPGKRQAIIGYRCVLAGGGVAAPQSQSGVAISAAVPSPVDVKTPQPQGEKSLTLDLGSKVLMKLALIPAGTFMMGSPGTEEHRRPEEGPQHEVTINKPFYMGFTHVTVEQFAEFVRDSGYKTEAEKDGWSEGFDITHGKLNINRMNGLSWRQPGFDQKGNHPVVQVSWNDAQAFCGWLSRKSGKTVALPTEAQWEYACRAGTTTAYLWGDDPDDGKGWANGADQSLMKKVPNATALVTFFSWDDGFVFTSPSGCFKANAFGLFDMIGNAAHWCEDRYGDYEKEAVTDPTGGEASAFRVVRGGSWNNFCPQNCRSAARYRFTSAYRNNRYGFRVVVEENSSVSAVPAANVSVALAANSGASWVSPSVPRPGRDGGVTLFDGRQLFGCNPDDAFFSSEKVALRDAALWINNAGCVFDLKLRNASLRACVKKISGQNITIRIGPYFGWFNGGKAFGISKHVGQANPILIKKGHSSARFTDFFDMEFTVRGGALTLTANGTTVVTAQAAPVEDCDAVGLNVWATGLSVVKRIEANLLVQ